MNCCSCPKTNGHSCECELPTQPTVGGCRLRLQVGVDGLHVDTTETWWHAINIPCSHDEAGCSVGRNCCLVLEGNGHDLFVQQLVSFVTKFRFLVFFSLLIFLLCINYCFQFQPSLIIFPFVFFSFWESPFFFENFWESPFVLLGQAVKRAGPGTSGTWWATVVATVTAGRERWAETVVASPLKLYGPTLPFLLPNNQNFFCAPEFEVQKLSYKSHKISKNRTSVSMKLGEVSYHCLFTRNAQLTSALVWNVRSRQMLSGHIISTDPCRASTFRPLTLSTSSFRGRQAWTSSWNPPTTSMAASLSQPSYLYK